MLDKEAAIRVVDPPVLFKTRLNAGVHALAPFMLALIVLGGLAILSLENLGTGAGLRHMSENHSEAILKLLFRNER